jgi:electron transfer flavoprotein alpha subunit
MAGVLVFGDAPRGRLTRTSLEVATAARGLAESLGEPLVGGLIGSGIEGAATELLAGGMTRLFTVDDGRYEPYVGEEYVAAGEAVVRACSPSVALFPHTLNTREWVPRLAARLQTGLTTDCTRLSVEGSRAVMTKPVYGGSVLAEYVVHGTPQMATVRAGSQTATPTAPAGRLERLEAPRAPSRVTVLEEVAEASGSGPRLKDARVVVAGGLGVGREHWHLVEDLAAALGGAVGATRAVTDLGWVPSAYQVGLTGTSVAPDLYVAIGISGAVQHIAGITAARTIVAINKDAQANIFTMARYGAIGDAQAIVPAFLERLKQLRS